MKKVNLTSSKSNFGASACALPSPVNDGGGTTNDRLIFHTGGVEETFEVLNDNTKINNFRHEGKPEDTSLNVHGSSELLKVDGGVSLFIIGGGVQGFSFGWKWGEVRNNIISPRLRYVDFTANASLRSSARLVLAS